MSNHLIYIINHVFLPSQLPQADDNDASKDRALVGALLSGLESFQDHVPEQERAEWTPLIEMIRKVLFLRDHVGGLTMESVEQGLEQMVNGGMKKATTPDAERREPGLNIHLALIRHLSIARPQPECGTYRSEVS